jgi:hypothetical protein
MTQENIVKSTKPKYSEMLMQLIEEFDEQLPNKLTFEETLEVGIDAWNLANNKVFLMSKKLYQKKLENRKNSSVIDGMVNFIKEKFPKFNNVIVGYSTTNDVLQVKTQTQENHFSSIIKQMMTEKFENKKNNS